MALWTKQGDWMQFQWLDGGSLNLNRSFTAAYKITDDPDKWSNRFTRVKAKEEKAVSRAIALMEFAVPPLIKQLGIEPTELIFLPALSSSETKATKTGMLTQLAKSCASRTTGASWTYHALTKNEHRPLHSLKSAQARAAELALAAYKAHEVEGTYKHFFVIDDFITRGDTLGCVADAIVKLHPEAKVYGLALGKTERRSWNASVSNDHVPPSFESAWKGV